MLFNIVFYLASALGAFFECGVPLESVWDWELSKTARCINLVGLIVAVGAINVLTDLLILAIPLWAIWRLNFATRSKVLASLAFACGFLYALCQHALFIVAQRMC